MLVARDYTKKELRAIFENPAIDTRDAAALAKAPQQSKRRFLKEVLPVIETSCKKHTTVVEFKKMKVVPRNVVKILFDKLLVHAIFHT